MSQVSNQPTTKSKKATAKAIIKVANLIIALFAAYLMASWAVPYAYEWRGYKSVGSEWYLIGMVFGAVYLISDYCLKSIINKYRKEKSQ